MRIAILFFLFLSSFLHGELLLKKHLEQAEVGDYLITERNKNVTALWITGKQGHLLRIEEITIPQEHFPSSIPTWREWLAQDAPRHTSHLIYEMDLNTGKMVNCYSFTEEQWISLSCHENLFSQLLTLPFQFVPERERRKTGSITSSSYWHPRMVVDGEIVPQVPFSCWKCSWPQDGSDLAGKVVQIYLPEDSTHYPAYFPYWLQVDALTGKARVRVIDSGRKLSTIKASSINRESASL